MKNQTTLRETDKNENKGYKNPEIGSLVTGLVTPTSIRSLRRLFSSFDS